MNQRAMQILQHVRENVELYATFAVTTILVFLEVFHHGHELDRRWADGAILITLLLLAISTIRDRGSEHELRRTIDAMADRIGHEPGVRWYARRNDATPDMRADLVRFKHLSFLGISHPNLAGYFRDVLEGGQIVPWETIEICFASDTVGGAFEGAAFRNNLAKARHEIAFLVTHLKYAKQLSSLRQVALIQYEGIATHTGSIFGNEEEQHSVVYVIHSRIRSHGDTRQGLTMRLEMALDGNPIQQARIDHYTGTYKALSHAPLSLGTFSRSIWDESAEQWSRFAEQSTVLRTSMGHLAKLASLTDGDSVLDVGAGTGETSDILFEMRPNISAVLLEGSPQMARLADNHFRNNPRARIALSQISSNNKDIVDIGPQKFSLVIIHQSLQELSASFRTLDSLARWCLGRLSPGGRVAIAAHDGVVACDSPKEFVNWKDPFRERLWARLHEDALFRDHLLIKAPNLAVSPAFSQDDVEMAFHRQGLLVKEKPPTQYIELTYEDRQLLWHVPAIMQSVIDVHEVGSERVAELVDEAMAPLLIQRTKPRSMTYWVFAEQTATC